MELILTGTAASFNIPAFRCACEVCSEARLSGIRALRRKNSCAVLLNSRGRKEPGHILIDAPPQFISQLEECGIDDSEIGSLLITHRHEDHVLGLFYLLLRKSKGCEIRTPLKIYIGEQTYNSIAKIFTKLADSTAMKDLSDSIEFVFVKPLEEFHAGGIKIVPLETNHLNIKAFSKGLPGEETLGYFFSENSKNLYYLVDGAKTMPQETIRFMKENKPDCMIIDCTYAAADEGSGHGDIESVIALRKQFPQGRAVISHIGHTNLNPVKLDAALKPHGIEAGYDGMIIKI